MSAPGPGMAALEAARLGFRVFPVTPRGKKPLRKDWQSSATTDLAAVEATWAEEPDANIGVACGGGLIVVDTDSDAGEAAMRALGLPPTPTVRTANGRHRYFNGNGRNRTSLLPGVDVRGDGGFVVGAGSRHPSGVVYEWEVSPLEVVRAPAPPALIALLSKRAARAATLDGRIEQGARNATLCRLACSIRGRYGASLDELLALLLAANARRCAPPFDHTEVGRIAARISPGEGSARRPPTNY
jgi:putative DNA primase/helicase